MTLRGWSVGVLVNYDLMASILVNYDLMASILVNYDLMASVAPCCRSLLELCPARGSCRCCSSTGVAGSARLAPSAVQTWRITKVGKDL